MVGNESDCKTKGKNGSILCFGKICFFGKKWIANGIFYVFLRLQNSQKGMKNLCNILNINKLSKNSRGGVNLLSEFSHTLSPRQAGMACFGFFCAYLSVFVTGGVFGIPPAPLTPPAPSEGGKGEARSGAELGSDRLTSVRPASGRFPPLEGVPEGRGSQATIQFMNL